MGTAISLRPASLPTWALYPNFDDIAKLEYGRGAGNSDRSGRNLLARWMNPNHPHRARFLKSHAGIEEILRIQTNDTELDFSLRKQGSSLLVANKGFPSMIGNLLRNSEEARFLTLNH